MKIIFFTDGACRGNPGPGGWGFLRWWNSAVLERGGAESYTTNSRMELKAVVESLRSLESENDLPPIEFYVDSKYVIQGMESWLKTWKRNGWKTKTGEGVKNQDLWKELDRLQQEIKGKNQIMWKHVRGHQGHSANERVDEIAVAFAEGRSIRLYNCKTSEYPYSLNVPQEAKTEGYPIYLSLIGGQVYRDADWGRCQNRISGKSRVKYKKVRNSLEEERVLKEWGQSS